MVTPLSPHARTGPGPDPDPNANAKSKPKPSPQPRSPQSALMLAPAAIGAGVAAGLLGIGGGMILGPIFVALQFEPQVGMATPSTNLAQNLYEPFMNLQPIIHTPSHEPSTNL